MHPHAYIAHRRVSLRRWMRTQEAANYTGHGKSTLEKLRAQGGGPPYVKRGTVVVYALDDLDRWLAERKVGA